MGVYNMQITMDIQDHLNIRVVINKISNSMFTISSITHL
jgi:hypothetical protein